MTVSAPLPTLYCSFCGASSKAAKAMFRWLKADVAICNDCVVLAVEAHLLPLGLIHLSGPRRMLAADIGVAV